MDIYEKLQKIQSELKAPKGQYNRFGKYKYRSCEDIVEALKPVLAEHSLALLLSDEIVQIGDRYYVKATATLLGDPGIKATAYAREPVEKKGMDASQITGTASSYARKYALNGLFAIDDTKDADTNEHSEAQREAPQDAPPTEVIQLLKEQAEDYIESGDSLAVYLLSKQAGPDSWSEVFNVAAQGQKTKWKETLRNAEREGSEVLKAINQALLVEDAGKAKENTEDLTEGGKKLLARYLGRDTAKKLGDLVHSLDS